MRFVFVISLFLSSAINASAGSGSLTQNEYSELKNLFSKQIITLDKAVILFHGSKQPLVAESKKYISRLTPAYQCTEDVCYADESMLMGQGLYMAVDPLVASDYAYLETNPQARILWLKVAKGTKILSTLNEFGNGLPLSNRLSQKLSEICRKNDSLITHTLHVLSVKAGASCRKLILPIIQELGIGMFAYNYMRAPLKQCSRSIDNWKQVAFVATNKQIFSEIIPLSRNAENFDSSTKLAYQVVHQIFKTNGLHAFENKDRQLNFWENLFNSTNSSDIETVDKFMLDDNFFECNKDIL
jgi:hypothetical protein